MSKKLCTIILLCLFIGNIKAQSKVNITFKYNFENSIKDYTYDTKLVLQRNGIKVGETAVKNQTIPNEATFSIPKGNATLKATIYALYNGKWEARTKDNNYSYDCVYEKEGNWIENNTISITVDIEEDNISIKENKPINSTPTSSYQNSNNTGDDFDKYKSNIDIFSSSNNSTTTKTTSSSNYQDALKKVNNYLKTFDNGYYGYLEIKDGYLYDQFKSGKYAKALINDLDIAQTVETSKKVNLKCKYNEKCVYSTYTDAYHTTLDFSQSANFNTSELENLLNNLLKAYKGNNSINSNTTNNTNTSNRAVGGGNTATKPTSTHDALQALNNFLKSFETRYQGMEIKDGYLYSNYANANYSKAKMSDLGKAIYVKESNYAKLPCKSNESCVFSTITKSYHTYFNFTSDKATAADYEKLVNLLDNVVDAYNGKTTTTNNYDDDDIFDDEYAWLFGFADDYDNKTATKYDAALNNLNDYLPTFNKDVYKNIEVKGNTVNFNYYFENKLYTTSINIIDLKNKTTVVEISNETKVKIMCNGGSKCFSGGWNASSDHFQFFPANKNTGTTKLKSLLDNFIKAL